MTFRELRLQRDKKSKKHDSYTHRLYKLVVKTGPVGITDNGIRKEIIKYKLGGRDYNKGKIIRMAWSG